METRELGIAMMLALSIEKAIAPHIGKPHSQRMERQGYGDETFGIDVIAEGALSEFCASRGISYISEDRGFVDLGSEFLFLVDPIDGTRNAMLGLPHWACSVAIAHSRPGASLKDVYAGLIREMDSRRRTFTAIRGKGAWLEGRKLKPKEEIDRERVTVATGGHFGTSYVKSARLLRKLMDEMKIGAYPRIYNSSALELAYVAEGSLNLDFDLRQMQGEKLCAGVHDVAAARLIVSEAGCPVTIFDRQTTKNKDLPLDPKIKVNILAACNNGIFRKAKKALEI